MILGRNRVAIGRFCMMYMIFIDFGSGSCRYRKILYDVDSLHCFLDWNRVAIGSFCMILRIFIDFGLKSDRYRKRLHSFHDLL